MGLVKKGKEWKEEPTLRPGKLLEMMKSLPMKDPLKQQKTFIKHSWSDFRAKEKITREEKLSREEKSI